MQQPSSRSRVRSPDGTRSRGTDQAVNWRNVFCGPWDGYPQRTARVYRHIHSNDVVGELTKKGGGSAIVTLRGLGTFNPSMVDGGSACEILAMGPSGPLPWAAFPSARSIDDRWRECAIGGRTLATRIESVPICTQAIAISDLTDPDGGTVYLGLHDHGVLLYPLLLWPIMLPLWWRRRMPEWVFDPRVVVGLERPAPAADDLVHRAAVVGLSLLATELADTLEPSCDH